MKKIFSNKLIIIIVGLVLSVLFLLLGRLSYVCYNIAIFFAGCTLFSYAILLKEKNKQSLAAFDEKVQNNIKSAEESGADFDYNGMDLKRTKKFRQKAKNKNNIFLFVYFIGGVALALISIILLFV